jgi:hypothetical protein
VPIFADSLDAFWRQGIAQLKAGTTFAPPERRPVADNPLPDCADAGTYDPGSPTGYCPDGNVATWSDADLGELHEQVGDLASGAMLAELWGVAGQSQADLPTDGRDAGLQRDCMTGAWIAAFGEVAPQGVRLSPGDVDELISTIIVTNLGADRSEDRPTAFERTDAFRDGVFDGPSACA